jgi:riboflavin biosynthesis pyrimidine reductase
MSSAVLARAATIQPLLTASRDAIDARGGHLPDELRLRYGSDLAIPLSTDRPTIVANFVSTLDGVVSYNTPAAAGGGEISGSFEPDRFVMGLLRALADVVLIGAGTLRADPASRWTPAWVHSESELAFAQLRAQLSLAPVPTTVVVTGSGNVDLAHPGLSTPDVPVLVVTSEHGAARLLGQDRPSNLDVIVSGESRIGTSTLVDVLAHRGARLVLCEGGPQLLGQLLDAGTLDELFLTVAPQIAGRSSDNSRLALVEGRAFGVDRAPWADLVDVRASGSHLFTRYRFRRS